MPAFAGFSPRLFQFLTQLKKNNKRDWFEKHKAEYLEYVLDPAIAFVAAFAQPLAKISPAFVASPKKIGGSIMRIYRDTRFSKDKSPYKTNVGIHFRHRLGKDVHVPGFYVHLAPGECFLGVGIWHPDSPTLAKIRAAIDADGASWKRARDSKAFAREFQLAGDQLQRVPREFDRDHPLADDLRRKDFIGGKSMRDTDVLKKSFLADTAAAFATSKPLMRFLCKAIDVPF
jgi:uncharacterized protein (TIGR02453 family)